MIGKKTEKEIDIFELAARLWFHRTFILKITSVFAVIGFFIAIFSANVYTSSVTMVPQLTDNMNKSGGLAGLAAIAGINLNDMGGGDVLPPTVYPIILENVNFRKELMQTKVNFNNIPQPLTLYDYFSSPQYQPFNLFKFLKKWTVGLPRLLINAIKGKDVERKNPVNISLLQLTQKENDVSNLLDENIGLSINQKEGTIKLTANMPEAIASTQLVEAARVLLQKYITDYKIDKVQQNLNFIAERYNEAKRNFELKQQQLAQFRDANQNVILAVNKTVEERLNSEYSLSFNLYSELAKQLEQAKIKVKQTQPVLTVIDPPVVPLQKSKPNRPMILFGFVAVGLFASCVYLFLKKDSAKISEKTLETV